MKEIANKILKYIEDDYSHDLEKNYSSVFVQYSPKNSNNIYKITKKVLLSATGYEGKNIYYGYSTQFTFYGRKIVIKGKFEVPSFNPNENIIISLNKYLNTIPEDMDGSYVFSPAKMIGLVELQLPLGDQKTINPLRYIPKGIFSQDTFYPDRRDIYFTDPFLKDKDENGEEMCEIDLFKDNKKITTSTISRDGYWYKLDSGVNYIAGGSKENELKEFLLSNISLKEKYTNRDIIPIEAYLNKAIFELLESKKLQGEE